MVGIFLFQLLINAFFFTFLFWILTFVAKFTYSNKFFNYKLNFYECGFKNMTSKTPAYELNFFLAILILLIYDGEFLILVPLSLNSSVISTEVILCAAFFLIWLLATLIYDLVYKALEWQI